jgi:hypothetical protein
VALREAGTLATHVPLEWGTGHASAAQSPRGSMHMSQDEEEASVLLMKSSPSISSMLSADVVP